MSDENDINATAPHADQVVVSIGDIKGWLKIGVTRRIGDPSYNAEIGSVQEKYNMSKAEVAALFQDERLKGLKVSTPKPSRIIIAEDLVESTEEAPSTGGDHIGSSTTADNGVDIPMESAGNATLETQGLDNTAFASDDLEHNF
jgi:hypothetical protein